MQTKGLIPFKSQIYHPMACLHFLRIPSRLSSYEALRDEKITTGHRPPSSKYAYFNSMGRRLRSRFWGFPFSSCPLSFLVNKGRISFFFFEGQKETHKSKGSFNFSSGSTNSSINSSCSFYFQHCSSTMVSIKQTTFGPSFSG